MKFTSNLSNNWWEGREVEVNEEDREVIVGKRFGWGKRRETAACLFILFAL